MGPQWWGMGRQLFDREPLFREALRECDELLQPLAGWSLLEEMQAPEERSRIHEACVAQPAILALQVGLLALWRSWGIKPDAVIGHSVGEAAAAYAAGALTLFDALQVIYHRSRLQQRTRGHGRMLAVGLSAERAKRFIARHPLQIGVAAVNGPQSVTLSGDAAVLQAIQQDLERGDIFSRFLAVDVPYHSPTMDTLREELLDSLAVLAPRHPRLPLYSTVTGSAVNGEPLDAGYWWRNVREPVRFFDSVTTLLKAGHTLYLEIGPHPVLSTAISACAAEIGKKSVVLASLRRQEDESRTMLTALGVLYCNGQSIDWTALNRDGNRFLTLPTYPWQRERCWQESEESRQVRLGLTGLATNDLLGRSVHPLLGRRLRSVHADPVWQADLDLQQDHGWLSDHLLHGVAIYPAAAYVEAALAAAREWYGADGCELMDVEYHKPLFLDSSAPQTLQLLLESGQEAFEVHSKESDGSWIRHASGRLRRLPEGLSIHRMDVAMIKDRCRQEVSVENCYREFHDVGLDYGPCFRGIEQLWRGEKEAIGAVRLANGLSRVLPEYYLHPALLDACFQAGHNLGSPEARGRLYLPRKIRGIRFYRQPIPSAPIGGEAARLWSHVRLVHETEEEVEADIQVLDDTGVLCAEIHGLRCQAVAGTNSALRTEDCLYQYHWHDQPRSGDRLVPDGPGCWIIFADRGGVGERLGRDLVTCGEQPVLVRSGTTFCRRNDFSLEIPPGQSDGMQHLLEHVGRLKMPCRGIVHLWALDTPCDDGASSSALEVAQESGCLSVLHLVQACAQLDWDTRPRLWLVTSNTQAVADPTPLTVAQAPLWGLGRVISNEHPEFRCTRIDLSREVDPAEIRSLGEELWQQTSEDEIALRADRRYVHRLAAVSLADFRRAASSLEAAAPCFRLVAAAPGVLDSLTVQSTSRRPPGPGEIEIAVRTVGLNFKDVAKAMNLLGEETLAGTRSSRELGLECAGTVVAVGAGVESVRAGDSVIALAPGSFRSHVTTQACFTAPKPASMSFEEAVTVPVAFLTALYALEDLAQLQPGERVLIHAASGGVGLAAIQIAQAVGAEIFATAGNPEKRDFLHGLGVHHVMDSRTLDFADTIARATGGEGIDVVLNSLTGKAIAKSLSLLRPSGRFLEIGKRDIEQNSKLGLRPFQNNLSYFAIDLDRLWVTRPETMARLFNRVMEKAEKQVFRHLPYQTFPVSRASEAFQHMARARHIGKVVVEMEDPAVIVRPGDDETLTLRTDGTYLITGGLGGFGLATARWMVERGARHIVLLGRNGPASGEAEEGLRDLETRGAAVRVVRADVTRAEDLSQILADIRRNLPALRGVIHGAMVLDDAILLRQEPARFRTVLAPKVFGAWNLHQLTRDDPLDFFVLYSSAAAIVGNRGQANYVAANVFLDALAHHRRSLGLPALTVNWTAIADVGYVAQHPEVREHLRKLGLAAIPARQLLKILGNIMQRDATQVAVMSLDGPRLRQSEPAAALPRFAVVTQKSTAAEPNGTPAATTSIRDTLRHADPDQAADLIATCVLEHVGKVLGTPPGRLDRDQSLTNMGVDSLMAVELSTRLKVDLGAELSTMKLLHGATIDDLLKDLAKQILQPNDIPVEDPKAALPDPFVANGEVPQHAGARRGHSTTPFGIDWKAECALDRNIVPASGRAPSAATDVLLTGATGFLGAFLLHDLLRATDSRVHCLVRCRDLPDGNARLRRSLEHYLLWEEEFAQRIVPVPGDLSERTLGLSTDLYQSLANGIATIYHNGAQVNLLQAYSALRPANVQGTVEILRLACSEHAKSVHFISSLGVFDLLPSVSGAEFREDDFPADFANLTFGYQQSKAVAELLVREAGARGLPVVIYRPGLINAASTTGAYTTDDFAARLLKSWIELGEAPESDRPLLLTPVDYVSRAIVYLSQQSASLGETFHFINPEPVTMRQFHALIRSAGYRLQEVPFDRWRCSLGEAAAQDNVLSGLLPFLSATENGDNFDSMPLWPPPHVRFASEKTLVRLQGSGIECPPMSQELVNRCVDYFLQTGFVTVPRRQDVLGRLERYQCRG
jgi:thioester reductase-like protein